MSVALEVLQIRTDKLKTDLLYSVRGVKLIYMSLVFCTYINQTKESLFPFKVCEVLDTFSSVKEV